MFNNFKKNLKENNYMINQFTITLSRSDGSQVILTPEIDKDNNLICEKFNNGRKQVPKFFLNTSELSERNSFNKRILFDIDYNRINNPEYQQLLANILFKKDRIRKILDEYRGYTGRINEKGGKELDTSIVRELADKQESLKAYYTSKGLTLIDNQYYTR